MAARITDSECKLCIVLTVSRLVCFLCLVTTCDNSIVIYQYILYVAFVLSRTNYHAVLCYTVCGYGLTMRMTTTVASASYKWNAVNSVMLYVVILTQNFDFQGKWNAL